MADGDDQLGAVLGQPSLRVHPSPSRANVASSSSARPIFRVFCKGMVTDEVVGLGDGDPGMPVLAVAVCGPQGEVVLRGLKPVLGFVGGHGDNDDGQVLLEAMALVEGLHKALELGITSVKIITDHRLLHNYVLGLSRPTGAKIADMINQALSARKQFEQCEISLVKQGQVGYMVKLAKEALDVEVARCLGTKEKRESCKICFEDVGIANMHAVEGCAHRFCFACMKKHMEVMLLLGIAPGCPQLGCTTKVTMEGSEGLLSPRFLGLMAQRVREEQIHPSQRIYCPYPKCSALMSLSEVQGSCSSDYTASGDAATLRKCLQCGGSMCVSCKVAWHERMSCHKYKRRYPYGGPEGKRLQKLVKRRLWQQCERCNHLIELAWGCERITCVCGYQFCYGCGKTWMEENESCPCTETEGRWRRRRGCFSFPLPACCRRGGMRR